jgi:hypothetical protein
LHVPNLIKENLFILNSNSKSTDIKTINRDTIVPNPSCGSSKSLSMFEYVGRLIGIAIRNSDTMLPFFLTSTFWKQLSRKRILLIFGVGWWRRIFLNDNIFSFFFFIGEKLNNHDFEGIDSNVYKELL